MNKFKLSLFLTVLLMLMLGVGKTWGQTTASIDFSAQGYTNAQEITDAVIDGNVSVAFYKGSNSNTPKYYTSGTAIRCYGGNYFTITSAEGNLTAITLTFGSGDGSNAITTNVGSFTSPTWTGDSPSVTFTIGGTTGNRRIKGISVTYASSTPTCATPTFAPEGGTYTEAQTVSISCETEGASIHYTLDGTAPTASSALYTAPVAIATTTTLKAIAVKEGNADSEVASATYTINLPTYTFNKIYAHSAVTATDTYMIVDVNSGKALTWANGTSSAPTAVPVTINGEQIVTDNTNLFWNIQSTGEGYVINPVGDDTRWLYST
ncbi:MAG: chitobiase/beta-hexosaminidase C-terminal domain-containing protein, partial [Bacteroidales bacterium]|nr:chitobiase/beta-hexosaminidase C-terminal domain-containing protein [Bacteroidales bacterium]